MILRVFRGIGKTTVSSWLARRDDVRRQFDVIAWLPLGQECQVSKCQELLHMQLTGEVLTDGLSEEERQERLAMAGRKVLLVLDDLWERVEQE